MSADIVVTGAAGFIGSQIVRRLLANGVPAQNILAVDTSADFFLQRECTRAFRDTGVRFSEFRGFLIDLKGPKKAPATIFHMGACSSTDELREDYLDDVNFGYSRDLWNLSSQKGVDFVYASSAATYGNGDQGFSDDPKRASELKPMNPYGASKQKFDLYVLDKLRPNVATPRRWAGLKFFNVYGFGEHHKGSQASVAYHARNQILKTGKLKLFKSHRADVADGEQKRDFVSVEDCVSVALACAEGKVQNGIYNVGSGEARSFLDLAKAVFASLGRAPIIEFVDTPEKLQKHYQYYTCAELTRLRAAGYQNAMLSLEEGVARYMTQLEGI